MQTRTIETLAVLAFLVMPGCMPEPPKPQKATDLESIEPKKSETGDKTKKLPAIPSGYVAKVNGVEIKTADFRKIYDLKLKKYRRKGTEIPQSSDRRYRKSITERLIYQEVVAQEAKSLGVEYDKKELEAREEKQRKGIKDWKKHLNRRGESDDSLRAMIIRELRESAIMAKGGQLKISDADVSREYERIKKNYQSEEVRISASHILCKVEPPARAAGEDGAKAPTDKEKAGWKKAALKKCTELSKKAQAADADFAALARENSEGPSAPNGGDLGIFAADRMVEAFSKVAFAMKAGEVSKPVETEFGFHVIKVAAVYPAGPLPEAALADKIRERLSARQVVRGRHDLEKQLLAKYDVDNRMLRILGDDKATTRGLKSRKKSSKPNKPGKKPDAGAKKAAAEADKAKGEDKAAKKEDAPPK